MARKEIGSIFDRNNRNNMNDNFKELYEDVENTQSKITDKVYSEIVDSAKLEWKEPVSTYSSLPTTSTIGETRMTRDTGKVYRYDGKKWIEIQEIDAGPVNEVDSRLSTQLAQTAKQDEVFLKSRGININDLDEPTRKAFLEAQGIDVNYVLGDKNVNPKNTTFFKTGKNLFDKTAAKLDSTVDSSDGDVFYLSGRFTTPYIPVEPNKTYTRSHGRSQAFYDSNKNYISGIANSAGAEESKTFIVPSNARYTVVAAGSGTIDSFQLEVGSNITSYEGYRELIDKRHLLDIEITPSDASFFGKGKNLFDKDSVSRGYTLDSQSGNVFEYPNVHVSDFIDISPNTTYTRSHGHTMGFYDANKVSLSGVSSEQRGKLTFTTPDNARYVRLSVLDVDLNRTQLEVGSTSTPFEPFGLYIKGEYLPNKDENKPKFKAEFTTTKLPREVSDVNTRNLSLVSKKVIQEGDTLPDTIGYLYLDESTSKLYYSAGTFDNPQFLFDWNFDLSGGMGCHIYNALITNDGDIIFMMNRERRNPIIYPANDYNNPRLIDFGEGLKPYAWETDTGVDIHPDGSYFVFGEYASHSLTGEQNNDPRNIWKVTKPFDNPDNWEVKHSFKHVHFSSPASDEPEREIGHIHTVIRDFYTDTWYCSTGDVDRHCRVWESQDEGETWYEVARDKEAMNKNGEFVEVAETGQWWRAFGMIYTEDAAYWGSDAHGQNVHALFRVGRNQETGVLDFSTIERIVNLDLKGGQPQPTYTTCYVRNPNGLLFLDRAEPRSDHLLDLLFWSFEYEELFKLGTFKRIPNEIDNGRSGWGNQVVTHYQATSEDGIVLGASTHIRRNKIDVLNNRVDNRVGNIKIRIYEV